ncbi:MAG: signal peptidase I, partial [Acidimicrobiia bacterium]|nr:signal peptidase I [Acidimicrobiia bacterium]
MRLIPQRRTTHQSAQVGPVDQRPIVRRLMSGLLIAVSLVTITSTIAVVCGLAVGYRPVVILTGSMGDTAPPGSLIVAEPRSAATIDVGDVVVMRRPGEPLITHRVIEIETNGISRFAITQGDANEAPDAAPYPLEGEQLVSRWVHPKAGKWALTVFQPGPALAVVALATVVIAIQMLRRIWRSPAPAQARAGGTPRSSAGRTRTVAPRQRRRRAAVLGLAPLATISGLGLAWALFTTNEPVPNNVFGTAACFDPQLGSVQDGETIHAVNGTVNVPITAVDPATSFVLSSVRSSSNEPADSTALVRLAADGSAVEIERSTDNGAPPAVTVAWSVVSYDCGVSVQRGTIAGDGTSSVTDTIATIDPGRSFVLLGSAPGPGDQDFGPDDLVRADLGTGSSVTVESAGAALAADRSYHWQVVTFADAADAVVQTIDVALGSSATITTGSLPTPVSLTNAFVLASVTSNSSGADIGERLVRARLVDATTVEVSRSVGGDPVDVRIQVVDLRDGTTVRHGIVDFATGETVKPILVDPVDTTRASAISSVAVPGQLAGGRSDHVADDVAGEGSATFAVTDSTTVTAERASSASNASFAWQLIEWAGPTWWDPDYVFRQRIDVETGAVAAPDAYTVPVQLDHAALVAIDAARADGTDVRVVWWDGSAWVELDRVLEDNSSWNQTDTTLLFRTQTPIAADSVANYWLYFGNPTPAPVLEDPENV